MINENEEQRYIQLEYLCQRELRVKTKVKKQRNIWLEDKREQELKRVKNKSEEQRTLWL